MKRITWPKAAEETGITIRQLRLYGETPEQALEAYREAAEEPGITDEMAQEAGFASADELIEAAEAEGMDPMNFMEEFIATAKPARKVEARKATPARREAQPQRGKPAAKPSKNELQSEAERMPYPETGKAVGDGEEAVADYAVFGAEDLKDFGRVRWQNKTDDDGNRLPDRLRATISFTEDQTLMVTVRKDGLGEVPGRERGEAVVEVLSGGAYAIDFPAENGGNGGLFLDCNPEVSGGRQFKFDQEGRLVWGSKSRTQFFRGARKGATEPAAREEPQAQTFRSRGRGKARR